MTVLPNLAHKIARSKGDPQVLSSGPSSLGPSDKLARALGWFSIGLGVTQLIAPQRFTRAFGMEGKEGMVRAFGAREISSGMLTLSPDKQAGLWSRVAGDGVDIVTLMGAMRSDNPKRDNVATALAMVLGITLLDVIGAQGASVRHGRRPNKQRLYYDRSGFPKGIEAVRGAAKNSQAARAMQPRPVLAASGAGS